MAESGILGGNIRTWGVDFTAHSTDRTEVQGDGMPESHKVQIQMDPTLVFVYPSLPTPERSCHPAPSGNVFLDSHSWCKHILYP